MKKLFKIIGGVIAVLIFGPMIIGFTIKTLTPVVAPPGQMVDIGGYKLHINCAGPDNDLPTIVVESGQGTPSLAYHWLQKDLSRTGKICLYDRAGVGWSEASDFPRDSKQISTELHTLLNKANIKRPFVFAGHSIAGFHMRVYTDMYPDDVAGIVFIDSSHPNQMEMPEDMTFEQAIEDGRVFYKLERIMMQTGLASFMALFDSEDDEFIEETPEDIIAQYKFVSLGLKAVDTDWAEAIANLAAAEQVNETGGFGDRPTVVLSAADTLKEAPVYDEWHKQIATLSSDGKHVVVDGANHMSIVVSKDHANIVAKHIRDVLHKAAQNLRIIAQ